MRRALVLSLAVVAVVACGAFGSTSEPQANDGGVTAVDDAGGATGGGDEAGGGGDEAGGGADAAGDAPTFGDGAIQGSPLVRCVTHNDCLIVPGRGCCCPSTPDSGVCTAGCTTQCLQ